MAKSSVLLMGSSQGKYEYISDACRSDGWYGYVDGNHTVAIYMHNFRGRVWIEASLANEPTETDWFPIYLNGEIPYAEYPRNPRKPSGPVGDTGVDAFNFTANVIWLRARLDRSHLSPKPATDEQLADLGEIKKILLND
jgi:hypothetical protein